MSNLLDISSLVLTPTAYNNGEALCIKPDDASGDFQFSRNSAATRVNAQGLVENVQILSSNLVQNGDFSEEGVQEISNGSFSQEGVEQITNGSFDTDSNWTKGTGFSISGGSANCDGTQSANTFLKQQGGILGANIDFVVGKTYKVNFDIIVTSGQISNVEVASSYDSNAITTSGNHTTYITAVSTNNRFTITANPDFIGSIDNCSVREVAQNWSLGANWSVGENKVTSNASGLLQQSTSELTVGKTYKTSFEITEYTSGGVKLYSGSGSDTPSYQTSLGIHVVYFVANGNTTSLYSNNFNGSITNISVKEVGQNWTLGSNIAIGENKLIGTNANSSTYQNVGIQANKKYKIQFTILDYSNGNVRFIINGSPNVVSSDVSSNGEHTLYINSNSGSNGNLSIQVFNNFNGSVTNISAVQISTDTNLPRINYEGFSYQDAFGSELLTDGAIINSGGGSFTFTPNGLIAISDGTSGTVARPIILWTTLTIGKQYRIVGTPTINSGNTSYSLYDGVAYVKNLVAVEAFDITFTCQGSSVFFTNDGTQTFDIDWDLSIKEVTGQEVVPGSGCGSWLFESQSTNLLPYSSDYTQWNKSGSMVITSNNAISPDGTQNASLLTANAANQFIYLSASAAANSTISLYIKRKTGTGDIELSNNGGSSYTVLSVTDEWNRVQVTFAASTFQTVIKINTSGDEIYLWGVQLEALSYASSLIPTSGSIVTRNQDLCNNGGSLASINSTEGTLYFEGSALVDATTQRWISLGSGGNANRVSIHFNAPSRISCSVRASSSAVYDANFNIGSQTNHTKAAIRYKNNDYSFFVNGVKVNSQLSGTLSFNSPLSELAFDSADGGSKFFGKTKALAVFPYLSDAELTELTTI